MRLPLLACFVALSACAVREQVDFVQGLVPGAVWQPVLVATTRAPDPVQPTPGHDRSAEVTFARYTVSIPPNREPGEIPRQRNRQEPDPTRHFMLAEAQPLQPLAYAAAVRAQLSEQPPTQREAMIFVHGFNTAFIEGVYRTAQLANDLHLPGVTAHYSWPSLGAPLAYAHDRDSVLFARDGLIEMVRRTADAGPQRILLIAHSMGAHLVMEALRQMALSRDPVFDRIGGVVLIAPDIDVELFRQQASAIGRLPQPFLVVISQRDRVLTLSARLTGETARLGNLQASESVADLSVTLVDVTAFGSGDGHFTVASSPALLGLLEQLGAVNLALNQGATARLPFLPGAILTLQNASEVILTPPDARRRRLFPWLAIQTD